MAKSGPILEAAGKEMKINPPGVLASTQEKFGVARAKRQKKAIMFSKARKAGANIPYKGV